MPSWWPSARTGAPQLGRISLGGKSPLTLGIKEANVGGPAGQFLDRLGIRAVIVQGTPSDDRLFILAISDQEKEKVWEIRIPLLPETMFGAGVAGKMGEALQRLKVRKLFIVTDPVMFSLGRAEEIRRIMEPRGLETVIFSEVGPDPPIELIERAGRLYADAGCDGILGMGGGSSMDTAKALGLRVTHAGDLREFEGLVGGGGKIKPVLPPIIFLPTTSGTGSEVNPCAVITDTERDLKLVLMSNHLIPRLAVIEPLFCRTMPPGLTIASGIDALAHCIEG